MSEYNETSNFDEEIDIGIATFKDGEEVTYNDIIERTVGLDEYGNPKAGFSLELGEYNATTQSTQIKSSLTYYNPSINIMRTGSVVIFDFIYKNRTDSELRAFWGLLNKYGKDFEKAMREDSPIMPLLRLQIVPNYYCGHYSIIMVTPMYWALQPETPTSEINTIRIVFNTDSVGFLETDGYDTKGILAELERDEMQRERIERQTLQRREEEEEYQRERNERIEELRRNRQYE